MPDTVFIYALKCPTTGAIRYVGKAENPKSRLNEHCSKAKRFRYHSALWIRSLLSRKLKPILEILAEVPEEHWQQWEVAWIEFFRDAGFDLVNRTPGGDGSYFSQHTPEARAKMSAGRLGRRHSIETREKMRLSHLGKKLPSRFGEKNNFFGKRHSQETCNRISEALKGNTPWNKNKLGAIPSPEARAKMSVSGKLAWEKRKEKLCQMNKI